MPITKKQAAEIAEVLKTVKRGPATLRGGSPFMPKGDKAEEARVYILREYDLWVGSWIAPALEDLLAEHDKKAISTKAKRDVRSMARAMTRAAREA
jgi:hypothetical protein